MTDDRLNSRREALLAGEIGGRFLRTRGDQTASDVLQTAGSAPFSATGLESEPAPFPPARVQARLAGDCSTRSSRPWSNTTGSAALLVSAASDLAALSPLCAATLELLPLPRTGWTHRSERASRSDHSSSHRCALLCSEQRSRRAPAESCFRDRWPDARSVRQPTHSFFHRLPNKRLQQTRAVAPAPPELWPLLLKRGTLGGRDQRPNGELGIYSTRKGSLGA